MGLPLRAALRVRKHHRAATADHARDDRTSSCTRDANADADTCTCANAALSVRRASGVERRHAR